MNMVSIRALTWGTVLAALLSAILLADDDAGLPDLSQQHTNGGQASPQR
jgi:hypothetical protein